MFSFKKKSAAPAVESPPSIYCDAASTNARQIFGASGLRLADEPGKADLLWLRKGYRDWFSCLRQNQFINHLPNEEAITDKGLLTENLKWYDGKRPAGLLALKDFYQETYRLYDEEERAAFFAQLPRQETPENLWILKPGDSSSGCGIQIFNEFSELRDLYAHPERYGFDPIGSRHIIQRYIRNPLLLEGRKSEIRIYWLIASMKPLRVLIYDEGTVRLNSQPFRLDDFDNTLIHVTNVYQQKLHPNYDPDLVLKWRFADWEAYLTNKLQVAPQGFVRNSLMPKLKEYLRFVVHATRRILSGMPRRGGFFGLYGADVILDDQLRPWLTEIQKGPGISFDDPVKKDLIPRVLQETIAIMLELQRSQRRGVVLKDLEARKHFEWVIQPE